MRTRVATMSTAAAALSLVLAGCGGGDKSFESSQELLDAVGITCGDEDGFFTEEEPASDGDPAMSEGGCESAVLEDGPSDVHLYAQVATDKDTSGADLEDIAGSGGELILTGENWFIELGPGSDGDTAAVTDWLKDAQKKVGGELQQG